MIARQFVELPGEVFLEVKAVAAHFMISKKIKVSVFEDISFSINKGETIAIIGPSGCGKSSLIKMILGIVKPTAGSILFNNKFISSEDNLKIGYMDQESLLLPNLNVMGNVVLPLRLLKDQEIMWERVENAIKLVNLEGFASAYPFQLSGGMKQRVSLARALALQPSLLCLDEPFSSVDEILRETLMKELYSIKSQLKQTIIFVTHNIFEAVYLSDKILVLSEKPSKILRVFDISFCKEEILNDKYKYYDVVSEIKDVVVARPRMEVVKV